MLDIFLDPNNLAALAALIMLELILGIDNLLFVSIVTNKLPEGQRARARNIGLGLALIFRLVLLAMVAWLMGLSAVIIDLGISKPGDVQGTYIFETALSWKDIIMIAGGLFLIWKATTELHEIVDPHPKDTLFNVKPLALMFPAAIVQIILIDMVFSMDSILTAVGMTQSLPIIYTAVIISMGAMIIAAGPLARMVRTAPTLVTLALAFILMIGMVLIAEGLGMHIPKGYIYFAMSFALFVETINLIGRKRPQAPNIN